MAYYSQSAINKARAMDLLTYLQTYEPDELVKISGNTYTTKTHDSLKISNGMWMWWSRGIGGRSAVDYLMRVRDMTFIEAVSQIANDESALRKQYEKLTASEFEVSAEVIAKVDEKEETYSSNTIKNIQRVVS